MSVRPAFSPRRRQALRGLAAAGLSGANWAAQGMGPLRVAVAASAAGFLRDWTPALRQQHGIDVVASVGSTGALYAHLRQGAPFHVFLAADGQTPARLVNDGFAAATSVQTYARGRLVLWGAEPTSVDASGAVLGRWARGESPHARLAIANPKLAPYGAAALQALERLGWLQALRPRLVYGDSVSQAHQFVASGNAALGLLARSVTLSDSGGARGSAWLVPGHLHDALTHQACVLQAANAHPQAALFMRLLGAPDTRERLRRHGYEA